MNTGIESAPGPSLSRSLAAWALGVAAVIHAVAGWVHREEGSSHVTFFTALTLVQILMALRLLRSWTGLDRALAATVALAATAVWAVSRTTDWLPGGREEIGVGDALAVVAQIVTAAMALVGTETPESPARPRRAVLVGAMAGVGTLAVALPAVAEHGHRAESSASITAVWAEHGGHSHGSDGATVLTGNGIVRQSAKACSPTAGQVAAADRLVAQTTLALERFRDVSTAVADGFRPLGFEPNGVYHYISRKYRNDRSVLDPTKPESIVYGRLPDGGLRPIGAMFMMSDKTTTPPTPGGCLMTWHSHGFPFADVGEETVPMVHVWTIPVPGGPFAHESGPDYARIYLDREPVPAEDINVLFEVAQEALQGRGITPERVGALLTLRRVAGSDADRCGDAARRAYGSLGVTDVLFAHMCDPLLSAPLPGVPDDQTVVSIFGNRTSVRPLRQRVGQAVS